MILTRPQTPFLLFVALAVGILSVVADIPPPPAPRFDKPPAWVTPCPYQASEITDDDRTNGYVYRLRNRQINLATGEEYSNSAYTITSPNGLQRMSEVSVNWAPEYQSVTIHFLRVSRAGRTEDLTKPERFQTMRREQNLQRYTLDGMMTALALIEDVRVGDTIEFAWTRRGRNPVLGNRFSRAFYGEFSSRVDVLEYRLLRPPARVVQQRPFGSSPLVHQASQLGGLVEERWSARDVKAVPVESDAPDWFDPHGGVELSEYRNWAEVVAWGIELFDWHKPLGDELEQRLAQIQSVPGTAEDRIAGVVSIVQDEIRYLSLAMGEATHRPTSAGEVFRRRFGDCKDKSLLLVALLQRLGFDASPALVDAAGGELLAGKLPAPTLFDHVIVRLRHDGQTYWIDGTRTSQGTGLRTRHVPDFRMALVLAPSETGLTTIERRSAAGSTVLVEGDIKSAAFDEPATIVTRFVYEGAVAESVRDYFANNEKAAVSKQSAENMRRRYAGAEEISPPRWEDDRRANRLVVHESYRLPDFWPKNEKKIRVAQFHPTLLYGRLSKTGSTVRKTPIDLSYPLELRHRIRVTLPAAWPPQNESEKVSGPGFRFVWEASLEKKHLALDYRWTTTADRVEPADAPEYGRKLAAVIDSLGYQLTHKEPLAADAPFRFDFALAAGMLGVFAVTAFGFWWYTRKAPPPAIATRAAAVVNPRLAGLRGWLILMGFGMIAAPFVSGRDLWSVAVTALNLDVSDALTNPASATFEPWYRTLVIVELFGNVAIFTQALFLPPLFFRRHFRLPAVVIIGWAMRISLSIAIMALLTRISSLGSASFSENFRVLGQLLFAVAIWLPYLLISKRVRATFFHGWRRATPPPLPVPAATTSEPAGTAAESSTSA